MKKLSILLLVLVAALASCKKTPEVNLKYVDVERDLVTVGMTTANIQCDYDYIATLKKAYLYYGEGENEDDFTSAEMRVVQKTLYVELMGLKSSTTYNYYYEFHNGFNFMRTALKSFKTEASPTSVTLPTVVTALVTEITANSAQCGGEVTNDGGAEVTERGICWSTNANPTLNDNHIAAGLGTGVFTAMMSGLEANTTYHVRAYAINEKGTAYGLDREFATIGGGGTGGVPEGSINGLFSVSPTRKVYFSQGNLQYQASTNTWRFAEHQWDYVGNDSYGTVYEDGIKCDNSLISASYNGWIDLFGWGTSGRQHGAINYQPYSTTEENDKYWVYGSNYLNLYDSSGQADWGFNAISNGGNQEGLWRTLAGNNEEFYYLLMSRNTNSGMLYAAARVNNVNGIILFPDNWDASNYPIQNVNTVVLFADNTISIEQWENTLEPQGCVFLPITGIRAYYSIVNLGEGLDGHASYWSSSLSNTNYSDEYDISVLSFGENGVFPTFGVSTKRCNGCAVRLVQDATSQPIIHKPTIITESISNISSNTAFCGGIVTSNGGAEVTERGICWSTNVYPTLNDSHIAVGTGMGDFTAIMSGLEANTTYYVRAYAINEEGVAYGRKKEFTTIAEGCDCEYVDLGLPSGTLWATCNVGANAPEEYGDYFSWGETQTKSTYDWSTYRYCNGYLDQLTKYCSNSSYGYNGFTDTLTVLLPEDDAATAWGSGWCTPTEAQWMELYQNTTNIWTTQNGVNGSLFTSANGATLFLPAAGSRGINEHYYAGIVGEYWSSALHTDYTCSAGYFGFTSDHYGMFGSNRNLGLSIRAVRSSRQN